MLTISSAANGMPTARCGQLSIHSAYNPAHEAAKFLDMQIGDFRKNSTVLIVGAGLGYLDEYLSQQRPDIRIIACHLFPELYAKCIEHKRHKSTVHRWCPPENIERFLFECIDEFHLVGFRIVEWPASTQAKPEMATAVSSAISLLVRRLSGNISSTVAFGRLWLRNMIRNFLEINRICIPEKQENATVIAASGPSLEQHLNSLIRHRKKFHLWALPSSLPALFRMNITPDLIFSTDPGHWAKIHGRYFPLTIPVAMPLDASPLQNTSTSSLLILSQNTIGESQLLAQNNWDTIPVPQAGSVVITAIDTWRKISEGPLVLIGLDLCWQDLQSHARPHSFDGWFASLENRTHPALTIKWNMAEKLAPKKKGIFRMGTSMQTYADWFKTTAFPNNVFRLSTNNYPSPPNLLHNIEERDATIFQKFKEIHPLKLQHTQASLSLEQRKRTICRLLHKWHSIVKDTRSQNPVRDKLLYTLDTRGALDVSRLEDEKAEKAWMEHQRKVITILEGFLHTHER